MLEIFFTSGHCPFKKDLVPGTREFGTRTEVFLETFECASVFRMFNWRGEIGALVSEIIINQNVQFLKQLDIGRVGSKRFCLIHVPPQSPSTRIATFFSGFPPTVQEIDNDH